MKKNYIFLSLLGTLWGILETQLGSLLHAADLPFVGLLMMSFGIFFQTMGRLITRMRGSALLMAIVVIFIKMLIVGGIAFPVAVAISIQSVLMELIYFYDDPSRTRMVSAGAVAVSYSLFHPFLSLPLFMGLSLFDAYDRIVQGGSALLGVPSQSAWLIFLLLLLIHVSLGAVSAYVSFGFAVKLQARGLLPLGLSFEQHPRKPV